MLLGVFADAEAVRGRQDGCWGARSRPGDRHLFAETAETLYFTRARRIVGPACPQLQCNAVRLSHQHAVRLSYQHAGPSRPQLAYLTKARQLLLSLCPPFTLLSSFRLTGIATDSGGRFLHAASLNDAPAAAAGNQPRAARVRARARLRADMPR